MMVTNEEDLYIMIRYQYIEDKTYKTYPSNTCVLADPCKSINRHPMDLDLKPILIVAFDPIILKISISSSFNLH